MVLVVPSFLKTSMVVISGSAWGKAGGVLTKNPRGASGAASVLTSVSVLVEVSA